MKVAVLGLGEAGIMYSSAFAQAGCEVQGFDIREVPVPEGVVFASSVEEAVQDAELILSLVTSRGAVAVAEKHRVKQMMGQCILI